MPTFRLLNAQGRYAHTRVAHLAGPDELAEARRRVAASRWPSAVKAQALEGLDALARIEPTRHGSVDSPVAPGEKPVFRERWSHTLLFSPSSWVLTPCTATLPDPQRVEREWGVLRLLGPLRGRLVKLCADLPSPRSDGFATPFSELPTPAVAKGLAGALIRPAGPWEAAQPGEAFALWMDCERDGRGYAALPRRKAAGLADAKLFSSEGAAREAAARYGLGEKPLPGAKPAAGVRRHWRSPAAVVRVLLRPIAIEPGGCDAPEVAETIARLEGEALAEAIRLPAGAPSAAAWEQKAPKRGRAWGQDACALWFDAREEIGPLAAGFVSRQGAFLDLADAQLFRRPAKAGAFWSSATTPRAVVRVRVRPVELLGSMGEIDTAPVEAAIAREVEIDRLDALSRAQSLAAPPAAPFAPAESGPRRRGRL
jgi:hypothetical protein